METSTADVAVQMPTASQSVGEIVILKRLPNASMNYARVYFAPGDRFEGYANQVLQLGVGRSAMLFSDGSTWWMVGQHP